VFARGKCLRNEVAGVDMRHGHKDNIHVASVQQVPLARFDRIPECRLQLGRTLRIGVKNRNHTMSWKGLDRARALLPD